ncbi:MAG TPA: potassium transporter TrkG [Thermodesulfobacteriota bacterium]|nr:potassium transporter TrkG [Thermodesulfobacteriota bacterium]
MPEQKDRLKELNPTQLVVLTFAAACVIGGVLLKLPIATHGGISFVDALFTATSAVCVTGLIVVDTGTKFTDFGKIVILLLIQVGGLGIATYGAVFTSVLTGRLSLKNRAVIRDSFAHFGVTNFRTLLFEIVLFTLLVELVGALFLFMFIPEGGFFTALFHSVAAFCNAGFSFYPDSFIGYKNHTGVNLVLIFVLVTGGIGFLVVRDLRLYFLKKIPQISLHSRIVLLLSVVLLVGGGVAILGLEWNGALKEMPLKEKILISIFQSATARTTGFNTIDLTLFSSSTLFIMIILMFIGASPGSCGGGIKTSTLAVLLAFIKDRSLGREEVFLSNRTIPRDLVSKGIAVVTASSLVIIFMSVVLTASESWAISYTKMPGIYMDALFEIVSAFGTVGLSLGLTAKLSTFGKIVVIFTMLIGRVGPLAIALAVGGEKPVRFKYAEERVMVG